MFEARLTQGSLLKKLVDAMKELVNEANFECSSTSFALQAMDTSHVSLVTMELRSDGFEHYRCDRNMSMGMSLANLTKVLKCAGADDVITMKADDNGDTVSLMFESPKSDRVGDFELKLMDIDSEHLSVPDTAYSATVTMPAGEFSRIVNDLASIGDTVSLSVTKDGVKFSTSGDVGTANVTVRQTSAGADGKREEATTVDVKEAVAHTFALRYLKSFTKATPLATHVTLSLSQELPLAVEYPIGDMGHLRYYLAPKIDDDDAAMEGEAEN